MNDKKFIVFLVDGGWFIWSGYGLCFKICGMGM